jgi:hypothetical protein
MVPASLPEALYMLVAMLWEAAIHQDLGPEAPATHNATYSYPRSSTDQQMATTQHTVLQAALGTTHWKFRTTSGSTAAKESPPQYCAHLPL